MRSDTHLDDACLLIVDCPHNTVKTSTQVYAYAVGTKAIADGRIDFTQARPVDEATYRTWIKRAPPREGDLILCREAPVGPVARVPGSPRVCLGQRTVLLRPNPEVVDGDYLLYTLQSPSSQRALLALAEGSTVVHLNVADVRSFPLSLPSVDEQARVAGVLRTLDDKIDCNRRLASLLEETVAAVFRARFVDFVGVEEFDESQLGAIPGGWSVGKLADLVEITMGQSPPGSSYTDDRDAGVLLVQGMGGFGARYPVSRVYTSAPTRRIDSGATLMTVRAPVGAVNVARTEVCLGRGVCGVTSDCRAYAEFLIRSLQGRWASEESGTIFPAVNKAQVAGVPVAIPPPEQIRGFDEYAAPIVTKLAALQDETDSLVRVRDALLPKLIMGEIRAPGTSDSDEVIGLPGEKLAGAKT
jgi:type I restriction enzyme, S subunit